MPLKYFWTKLGLIPISTVNMPMGSLLKSISIEKLKEVEAM